MRWDEKIMIHALPLKHTTTTKSIVSRFIKYNQEFDLPDRDLTNLTTWRNLD